jgi:hypothetical protein
MQKHTQRGMSFGIKAWTCLLVHEDGIGGRKIQNLQNAKPRQR